MKRLIESVEISDEDDCIEIESKTFDDDLVVIHERPESKTFDDDLRVIHERPTRLLGVIHERPTRLLGVIDIHCQINNYNVTPGKDQWIQLIVTNNLVYCWQFIKYVPFGQLSAKDCFILHQLAPAATLQYRMRQSYLNSVLGFGYMTVSIYTTLEAAPIVSTYLKARNLTLRPPLPGVPSTSSNQFQPQPPNQSQPQSIKMTSSSENDFINKLYQSFLSTSELNATEPSSDLKTSLLKHQKQALYFMITREAFVNYSEPFDEKQSLWRKQNGTFTNVITNSKTTQEPAQIRGGIIADDMGIGKTIQTIALILNTKIDTPVTPPKPNIPKLRSSYSFGFVPPEEDPVILKGTADSLGLIPSKSNLVICPLSIISNWEEQIELHCKQGALSVYVYHGQKRSNVPSFLAAFDVVLTTYQTLALYAGKNKKLEESPLHQIYWYRIVLDEAHVIRTHSTVQAKSIHSLKSERKWCLTGTPIQNKIDDLFSLFCFLNLEPFNMYNIWSTYIGSLIKGRGTETGFKRLDMIMKLVTLRRVKTQQIEGKPIIDLPEKDERIQYIELSTRERAVYDKFKKIATDFYAKAVSSGDVMHKYAHILELILRLRQACSHEALVPLNYFQDHERKFINSAAIYSELQELGEDQCGLCKIEMGDQKALLTICGHLFCQKCIPQPYNDLACPVCFKQLSNETIKLLNEEKEEDLQPVESSSKINKLICDILTAIQEDRTNKSVVFSQWTGMLKLVEMELKKLNIGHAVLDGSMSRKDRTAAMDSFAQQQRISVFLISIRAGGVGLNLTMATRIFILEPHWNPSIEQQAIDRVHRIGQTKHVVAIHYIVKDSIEEKMLKLQEYKKQLSKIALKAEMSAEDKKKDRLLNLKMLLE